MKIKLKKHKKLPAPVTTERAKAEIAVDLWRRPHYWLDECTKRAIEKTKENLEKIKSEKDFKSPHSEFLTNDIGGRRHLNENKKRLIPYVTRTFDPPDVKRISEDEFTKIIDELYDLIHNHLIKGVKNRKFPDIKVSEYADFFDFKL